MKLKIRGRKKIQGFVRISGSKNSAVAILPAAILCDEEVIIRNVPHIEDINSLVDIISNFGYSILFENNTVRMKQIRKIKYDISSPKITKLRGSTYFMGAFLGKIKKIKTIAPGGCNLGYRPINYHLDGFKKLNVKVKETDKEIYLKTKKIIPTTINLDFPSVGATINLMLATVKGKGKTIITNCALEPEVSDVANFLNSMGADIKGIGTSKLTIEGVNYLHSTDYTIISDRIEAGTYLILGAISSGDGITLENVNIDHLDSLITILKDMGFLITHTKSSISIKKEKDKIIKPTSVIVGPYPSFPTDLGQPLSVLMTQINGTSYITETIYRSRFSHIEEINRMNGTIQIEDNKVIIYGPMKLKAANVTASDLRGSASLVLAALTNKGLTTIDNIDVMFRGYENFIHKFKNLGVNMELIED